MPNSGTQPLISVILPFLNGGAAFAPAINSIRNQTYQNWELLLCDDRSTDGSLEYARSLKDSRIIVWSDGRNLGLAARLNECIARARGNYIARMDADDLSYPQRLEMQAAYLLEHPEIDVVGCHMLICTEDGQPIGKRRAALDHAGIVAHPAVGFDLAHPTWMARAEWYRRFLYDPSALRFEDAELLYRAYQSSTFANLPDLLYGYREMRGGLSKRFKTRLGRIRYLHRFSSKAGVSLALHAAFTESVKAIADAAITKANLRYTMLRRREAALSEFELTEWNQVLKAASLPVESHLELLRNGACA